MWAKGLSAIYYKLATNAVSGWKYCQFHQALGVILPERGAKVHAKDAKLRLKDALMRTFGAEWKNSDVEGEVR